MSRDWNAVGLFVWRCLFVIAVIATLGTVYGMLGEGP